MTYTLIALAAVVAAIVFFRLSKTNPSLAAKWARAGAWAGLIVGGIFALRGQSIVGLPLLMLGSWILWGRLLPFSIDRPASLEHNQTDHLDVHVNSGNGRLRGRVLKGIFAGRSVERMAPAELAMLWRDCSIIDKPSARLIENCLDRLHPSWREDMARAEAEAGPGGVMTATEALSILGLEQHATHDQIRKAHRDLMLRIHPDRGGSGYLASKVNEAKDVLLGR